LARTTAEIISLYYERKKRQAPNIGTAIEVRDQYNGDVVVPLPEMERNERVAVANLLSQGLDQTAMRIASTQPSPYFPPLKINKTQEQAARERRQAMLAWWKMNKLAQKDRRRARHLIGYASAPVILMPDFKRKIPTWHTRDPLATYPAPSGDPDNLTPDDCIFAYHQPYRWLKNHHEDAARIIARKRRWADGKDREDPEELFEIIEYVDDEIVAVILMGKKRSQYDTTIQGADVVELARVPNLAGVCTAVVPGRITLDRPQGQFDGLIGMFQQQAKLQALSVIATEKGIFKDEWLVARQGEIPKIVKNANGRMGEVGIVTGGELKAESLDPSYMTNPMIDRLERYQRLEGGIPAQFGGETSTNIRTGRMGDAVMSAVIDFPVQEAQETLALAREEEDKRAIAIDKGYWSAPKSFYVSWKGENARVDYTPQDLWTTDEHNVTYSHAGADINGLSIVIGQLLGMGLMSKRYAMQTHPLIEDAERMHDETVREGIEAALLASLQQQASQPGANVADFARIMELVDTDKMELAEAILAVQKEAQERQAAIDAEGNPATVDPLSPEAQPGLAAPGMGAEAAATIPPPEPSIQNLGSLLGQLRRPQMTLASETAEAI
jgi:hypothetical protein